MSEKWLRVSYLIQTRICRWFLNTHYYTNEAKMANDVPMDMPVYLTRRLLSLGISALVSLASGTPYLYGIYAPQLIKRIGLTTSDSATMSLATNIGCGIGGFPGGLLIDHYGPQLTVTLGSVCIFFGYFGLYKIYDNKLDNLFLICIWMVMIGFGSIISYFSTIKAVQANFPKHKGSAGSIPVSAYGLSATVFSAIMATLFNHEVGILLKFLSIFCGSVTFIGSWFIHIYLDHDEDMDSTHSNSSESTPIIQTGTNIDYNSQKDQSNDDIVVSADSYSNILIKNTVYGREHPVKCIKRLFSNKIFLSHYLIVSLASGIGQMYIYSVGFIVTALVNYDKKHEYESGVSSLSPNISGATSSSISDNRAVALQTLQVSIISIASFSGRLVSGFLSDFIFKTLHIQRLWIVSITLLVLAVGQFILIINVSDTSLVSLTSSIIGGCFGLLFGTYPALIADKFGTRSFSTTWGLICTCPLITLYILNKYFGFIYDRNTDLETGICYKGNGCYKGAFEISFPLCFFIVFVSLTLTYIQRKTGR